MVISNPLSKKQTSGTYLVLVQQHGEQTVVRRKRFSTLIDRSGDGEEAGEGLGIAARAEEEGASAEISGEEERSVAGSRT